MNAARARKRTKDQIQGLRKQVADHAESNSRLQRKNKELSERLDQLEAENKLLRAKVFGGINEMGKPMGSGLASLSDASSLLQASSLKERLSVMQPPVHSSLSSTTFLGNLPISQGFGLHHSLPQSFLANEAMEAEKKQALLRLILSANSA
jgi:hypothetical protein